MKQVKQILLNVENCNTPKIKEMELKHYADNELLQKVIHYTYNPFMKYKITNQTFCSARQIVEIDENMDIFSLMDLLSKSNINDNLRNIAYTFVEKNEEFKDLYKKMLTKDLKIGIGPTTFNKIWKGIVPKFELQLASKYDFDKHPDRLFCLTEKLDGIRCISVIENGEVNFYTRSGKKIEGLKEIEKDLLDNFDNIVFDGELLAKNCSNDVIYTETISRVNNKNEEKTGVLFNIFDVIQLEEYKNQKSVTKYKERRDKLDWYANCLNKTENIKFLEALYIGSSQQKLKELLTEIKNNNGEGLMLNFMDDVYEFKRSKNILKVKVMQTADLRVIDIEEGKGRNKGKLGAAIVELTIDGETSLVHVGSGWNDYDRNFYWNNKEEIINKIIEVQYFEISKDSSGKKSLRFPVFSRLRNDKDEPSLY